MLQMPVNNTPSKSELRMIQVTTELLLDALVLALHCPTQEVYDVVKQVVSVHEKDLEDNVMLGNPFSKFYVNLLNEVMLCNITTADSNLAETFLLKFKSNPQIEKDPELYTTLRNIFTDTSEFSEERATFLLRKLRSIVVGTAINKGVKKIFAKITNCDGSDPTHSEIAFNEIKAMCQELITDTDRLSKKPEDANIARRVDFQDRETISKALNVYNNISVKNKFKTGLQGLNRALGGGLELGSSVVINARAHNGKTLTLLNFARWAVTLNPVSAEFNNPTCLFISLENETPQNSMLLFRSIYINKFHQVPPEDLTDDAIVDYCYEEFNRHGWKFVVDRRLGSEFGFPEFVSLFESYEREGFTPLMCVVDYVNMMAKGGGNSESGANYLQVKELYTNMCNFLKSKNCTFITAHQLNRRADEEVAKKPVGAVKRFGPEMISESSSVQREMDIVFYQEKEVDGSGRPFLTFQLRKHRYRPSLPESVKYFAYPFLGELGILDDVDGADMSTNDIYAYPFDNPDIFKPAVPDRTDDSIDTAPATKPVIEEDPLSL